MFKNILVCTDGSERALQAARAAAELARACKARLTVLHVCAMPNLEPPFAGAPSLSDTIFDRYVKEMHIAVLERTLPVIKELSVPCDTLERVGDPADVIARTADAQGFDLIVMGTRGVRSSRADELGSVSYGVAHRAHCALLLVKQAVEVTE